MTTLLTPEALTKGMTVDLGDLIRVENHVQPCGSPFPVDSE